MSKTLGCIVATLCGVLCMHGCASDGAVNTDHSDAQGHQDTVSSTVYTEWSEGGSGTTAKPKYGQGCRYQAVDGELWEFAADGDDDRLVLEGPPGPPYLSLLAASGGRNSDKK